MKEKKIRIRRKNAGYKKIILLLIIVFILILMITKVIFPTTVSLSRYVYSVVKGAYLNSKEFYFTSNRMTRKGDSVYEVKNWDGTRDCDFTVNMYSSKNSLKKSNVDITYKISIEVQAYENIGTDKYNKLGEPVKLGEDNKLFGQNDYIDVTLSAVESIIYKSSNQDGFQVSIHPKNRIFKDNDYIEIKLTAKAISPYEDTITGIYRAYVGREGISIRIEDSENSPYMNVILTNAKANANSDEVVNIDLEFNPEKIVLDTTLIEYMNEKALTNSSNYFEKITIGIKPLESKFIKFYKKDITKDYSYPNEDNTIIVNCIAEEKAIVDGKYIGEN